MRSSLLSVAFLLSLATCAFGQAKTSDSLNPISEVTIARLQAAAQAAQDAAVKANAAAKAAQEAAEKALASTKPKPTSKEDQALQDALDQILPALHLNGLEHLGRATSVSVSMVEQPSQVQIGNVFAPTPQGYLTKGSLTFTPAEFFTTPGDINAEVTAFKAAGGHFNPGQNGGLCHDPDAFVLARCLVRSRKRDVLYRTLSGLTGTVSYAENLRVKSNTLIEAGSAAASKNNQWTGSVTFSAVGIVLTGSDWASAQKSAAEFEGKRMTTYEDGHDVETTVSRELLRVMVRRCDAVKDGLYTPTGVDLDRLIDVKCVKRLAGPYGLRALVASGIPDVTYQVQSQFDFVKNGNVFIPNPALQATLWTVSAKWDLSKWLAPGKSRIAALSALVAAYKQEKTDALVLGKPIDNRQ